jgi:hypothetical protein
MIVHIEYMGRPSTWQQLWKDLEAGNPSVGRLSDKSIR